VIYLHHKYCNQSNNLAYRGMQCYNICYSALEVKKGRHKRRKEDRKEDDAIGIGKYNIDGLIMLNLN
jgi:hypothetical protein